MVVDARACVFLAAHHSLWVFRSLFANLHRYCDFRLPVAPLTCPWEWRVFWILLWQ